MEKFEIRNPKHEGNWNEEEGNFKTGFAVMFLCLLNSAFGFPADFALRISDLPNELERD
jgi:hypothetical protein